MRAKLGEMLVKAGLITSEQLHQALHEQKIAGGRIGYNLVKLGFISEKEIAEFLGKQYNIPSIELSKYQLEPEIINLIPPEVALKYLIIPISKQGHKITIAIANPTDIFAIDDVKFITGCEVEAVISPESSIRKAIDKYYSLGDSLSELVKDMEESEVEVIEEEEKISIAELRAAVEEAPIVKLVNTLITDAVRKGASDIHIEPYEKVLRVRFRIDGVLHEVMSPPVRLKAAIISRIKIMAELNIAERRVPQDGRIKVRVADRTVDLRVSTLPTLFGEKIVLRILDKSALNLELTQLGFERSALQHFEKAISCPFGMVLVTGPTGSGKSTTLYSALNRINTLDRNIMTAEDPVEYDIKGINQVQIKEEIGFTFATALRAFLRQDPNVIMVGEIRDRETAEIAIRAALTGHLVLSTLHTNDAPSTIHRLIDMGIEPFLIVSSLNLIVAQRLVRRICMNCKQPVDVHPAVLHEIKISNPSELKGYQFYKGKGCSECNYTGYKGRIGIYEVMPITQELKEMILERVSVHAMKEKAIEQGMMTLRESAIEKLKQGITTVEEVIRETTEE